MYKKKITIGRLHIASIVLGIWIEKLIYKQLTLGSEQFIAGEKKTNLDSLE